MLQQNIPRLPDYFTKIYPPANYKVLVQLRFALGVAPPGAKFEKLPGEEDGYSNKRFEITFHIHTSATFRYNSPIAFRLRTTTQQNNNQSVRTARTDIRTTSSSSRKTIWSRLSSSHRPHQDSLVRHVHMEFRVGWCKDIALCVNGSTPILSKEGVSRGVVSPVLPLS